MKDSWIGRCRFDSSENFERESRTLGSREEASGYYNEELLLYISTDHDVRQGNAARCRIMASQFGVKCSEISPPCDEMESDDENELQLGVACSSDSSRRALSDRSALEKQESLFPMSSAVSTVANLGKTQLHLVGSALAIPLPAQLENYPEFRYMGSKRRLLPWIHGVLSTIDFESAADPFVGSGCVAYLMKCMGKRVVASDFLNFPATLATATIRNNSRHLDSPALKAILAPVKNGPDFIEKTFSGIFYTSQDLRFLDRICHNIEGLSHPDDRALARSALIRSCLKKQPRGVFTFTGDRYDDGRRDLRLTIEEHFLEQIEAFNHVVFDNGRRHSARRADVFELRPHDIDLVYLDPPYVPRADDNCYVKRYHFLEGLSCYWRGLEIMKDTKVRKIKKLFTPFSYRRTAIDAFDRMFHLYRNSTIVLSYSSNGFPDRDELENLLRKYKRRIDIYEKPHRYHFGTHEGVERAEVQEYLLVGR